MMVYASRVEWLTGDARINQSQCYSVYPEGGCACGRPPHKEGMACLRSARFRLAKHV